MCASHDLAHARSHAPPTRSPSVRPPTPRLATLSDLFLLPPCRQAAWQTSWQEQMKEIEALEGELEDVEDAPKLDLQQLLTASENRTDSTEAERTSRARDVM